MTSAMRSLPHLSARDSPPRATSLAGLARDRAAAEARLGLTHPLVGLLASSQTSVEQLWAIAAVALIGSALLLAEARSILALLIGAGAAESLLIARWVIRRVAVRDVCLDLIIEGRGDSDVRVLDGERCRLAEPRHRARLARSITSLVQAAERPPARPRARPMFSVRVIRGVAPELRAIAEQLRAAAPAVQGVALIERLLHDGASPLYGSEVEPLRRELGRARYLLEERVTPRSRHKPAVTSSSSSVRTGPW
jgi:hypothetical protein